jgi:hypothetical protein
MAGCRFLGPTLNSIDVEAASLLDRKLEVISHIGQGSSLALAELDMAEDPAETSDGFRGRFDDLVRHSFGGEAGGIAAVLEILIREPVDLFQVQLSFTHLQFPARIRNYREPR